MVGRWEPWPIVPRLPAWGPEAPAPLEVSTKVVFIRMDAYMGHSALSRLLRHAANYAYAIAANAAWGLRHSRDAVAGPGTRCPHGRGHSASDTHSRAPRRTGDGAVGP